MQGSLHWPAILQVREKYAVDECHYVDQLAEVLASLAPPALHVLSGVNSDRRVHKLLADCFASLA